MTTNYDEDDGGNDNAAALVENDDKKRKRAGEEEEEEKPWRARGDLFLHHLHVRDRTGRLILLFSLFSGNERESNIFIQEIETQQIHPG